MNRLAVLAVPLLLAACSHVPQRDARGDEPQVPADWRTAAGPQAPLALAWWNGFGDPVLTTLVEAALANNLDVATAAARVREARAQEDLARSQLFPTLDFSNSNSRGRTYNPFGVPTTSTTRQRVFEAAYEVDLFGRIAEQVSAAHAGTQAGEAARAAAALSVAAATATGYITLRSLDARLALLEETVRQRRDAMRVASERAAVGYTSDLELRQAEAEYESAAQQVPPTRLAIERQEHALALLTGTAPRDIARGRPLAGLTPPPIPAGLPSDLLRRRPDLFQAESTLVAADATLASTRAQFLPSLQLTASLGRLLVTPLEPITIWSLGASVLAPLFDGGRIEAQVNTAGARREQAAYAYQRAVLTAFREVEDNLSAVVHTREQRTHLQAERAALADALFHAQRRYRAGYSSYLEQLDAQRGVLTAELALIQAMTDELTTLVALSQAMGGGWEP
ncbi:efflux transporter outer membrane subunit [Ramlibacter sp.]|uniref:efflux transporter outer membrane subunit n=1 Tax=Ramlibacter sp. TaxID=1917967 RepID=UPI002609890C|nr:efflux transporter outer membrane subunit [Ramlibacter sp.]MDB5958558.1 efflux transporter outer rane subunit [Ramlibacter sp.]